MEVSPYLIAISGILYLGITIEAIVEDNFEDFLIFFGYAISVIGFIIRWVTNL